MVHVNLKKADGSIYWQETFFDLATAQKWAADQKTQPSWLSGNTSEVIDTTTSDQAAILASLQAMQAQLNQSSADKSARDLKVASFKAKKGKIVTLADLVAAVEMLMDLV